MADETTTATSSATTTSATAKAASDAPPARRAGLPRARPRRAPAQALVKEARLRQAQAQKFSDLAVSREQAAAPTGVQAFVELQNKWVSEVKADPDIGGDKLVASLATAARAIDRLGVPGLKEALDLTGAGNHPAVVKAFVRLGQMVSEDRFAPGNHAPPSAPATPAEATYGRDGPKQTAPSAPWARSRTFVSEL